MLGRLATRATAAAVLAGLGAGEAQAPRGVGPGDAGRYVRGSGEGDGFHCLDDSAELPLDALNDDFCDCADGSDEPGTAACSGLGSAAEALFFCKNDQSQSKYVYRSRVNDGICDCCDGSDEERPRSPIQCQDTCFEDGRPHREEQQQRQETWQTGVERQKELAKDAEAKLEEWRVEAKRLKGEMPALKSEREDRKKALEDARSRLPPEPEPAPPAPPPTPAPATAEEAAVRAAEFDWKAAVHSMQESSDKLKESEAKSDPLLTDGRRALALLGGKCLKHQDPNKFEYKICFFTAAHQDTDSEKNVLLGRWRGWELDTGEKKFWARFEGGSACGDNKARRLSVKFECGTEVKIKHLSEPRSCEYEASVFHPGGCDASKTPKDASRLAAWNSILALQKQQADEMEAQMDVWKVAAIALRPELTVLERQVDEAKLALDAAKKLQEEAAAAPKVAEEQPKEPPEDSLAGVPERFRERYQKRQSGSGSEESPKENGEAATETPKVSEYAKWMEGAKEADMAAAGAAEQPKVSEYAKWMEGGSDATNPTAGTATADPVAPASIVAAEPSVAAASEAVASTTAPAKTEDELLRETFKVAEDSWSAADSAFFKAKYRLKGLEVSLDPNLAGTRRAFASLEGQCLEKTVSDDRFKVCFFRHAHAVFRKDSLSETETNLGRWMGWSFPTDGASTPKARFDRGAPCEADGVSNMRKSLTVSFKCGPESEVLSVEDRSGCAHDMEVQHPGACDASELPEKVEKTAHMPKDEL